MMRITCLFTLLFLSFRSYAEVPKREFRAVWIATVANIDWPSKKGLSSDLQKQEYLDILNRVKQNNMNAVIVQIRPCADAFYPSPNENWSRYLSGTQGQAPTPFYDPLEFMIEEAHKRCIEFHAWFNPYRALIEASKNPNTPDHITWQHPEWFINYGGKKYFDPGLPEVRSYFTNIVMDVVKRYNIDAVHFDDYFYPYRIAHVEFGDEKSYSKYGSGFNSKDDWRRNNVSILIKDLSKKIKTQKSFVKFGISPFGVWRNQAKDPQGSATNAGQTNYDDLYADVLLWLKEGWIDYILPQLYWENGHRAADYYTLINWWADKSFGKHVYIGHGIYQLGSSKPVWRSLNEMSKQIELVRTTNHIQGSSFYSANAIMKDKLGINEEMKQHWYAHPALLPAMNWLEDESPKPPKVKVSYSRDGYRVVQWTVDNPSHEDLQFAVYRFKQSEKIDITNSNHLIEITRNNSYLDQLEGNNFVYIVTSLDRLHNESSMSNTAD